MDVKNIIQVMKSRQMRRKGHLTYIDNRNTHTQLCGKTPKKETTFKTKEWMGL